MYSSISSRLILSILPRVCVFLRGITPEFTNHTLLYFCMYRIFNTMDLLQPVVVDNGSLTIKAGFAATEVPKVILPN